MRSMIAYSAIPSGALIFGNKGTNSLFNDAIDIGKAIPNLAANPLWSGQEGL